ncbi:MAG: hypothetical protein M3Q45_01230, partial [Chloroflexota bacterium]|nr:hypothetical protein [Chloroflexota bacterium]
VYVAIGGLDEEFWPGYFEDVDYCLRAQAQGFEVWYTPTAQLQHQESVSISDKLALHHIFNRNRLRFALKHLPPLRWLAEAAPAEEQFILTSSGQEAVIRQANLLEAAAVAPALLLRHWQADQITIHQVVATLRRLADARSAALRTTLGGEPNQRAGLPVPPVLAPLTEFDFASNTALVGLLFSGFRRLWYNVAARWAILHLRAQQDRINQQQFVYNQQVQAQMQTLHAYYQQEIEQLQQQAALATERGSLLAQQLITLQHQVEQQLEQQSPVTRNQV